MLLGLEMCGAAVIGTEGWGWLASEGGGAAAIKGGRVKGDKMNILNFKFMFCSQNLLNY
jgi:hypothetical protein